MIGNKSDLKSKVKSEDVAKYAQERNIAYIETSAKTGSNVDQAFAMLTTEVYSLLKQSGQFS